jgi:hypothetical protein
MNGRARIHPWSLAFLGTALIREFRSRRDGHVHGGRVTTQSFSFAKWRVITHSIHLTNPPCLILLLHGVLRLLCCHTSVIAPQSMCVWAWRESGGRGKGVYMYRNRGPGRRLVSVSFLPLRIYLISTRQFSYFAGVVPYKLRPRCQTASEPRTETGSVPVCLHTHSFAPSASSCPSTLVSCGRGYISWSTRASSSTLTL